MESGDEAKAGDIRHQIRGHIRARSKPFETMMVQLADVLEPAQMNHVRTWMIRWPEPTVRPGENLVTVLSELNLTQKQKIAAKEIMDAARKQAEAAAGDARRKVYEQAWQKIKASVLNDEQRAKLEDIKKNGPLPSRRPPWSRLGLSPEQQSAIDETMRAAHSTAAGITDASERASVLRQARKKILDEVLTEEQRRRFDQPSSRPSSRPTSRPARRETREADNEAGQ